MNFYSKVPLLISMMFGASVVNAIEISPDDRGQLLIAPLYQASEGKSTEVRVVNPSRTHAVKAVVSVRSSANSLEILNFNLYLTPTDVWTGELRNTGSGVELYSEDDSILIGLNNGGLSTDEAIVSGVFAEPGNGVVLTTFNERDSGQQVELGHFEVLGVYSISGDDIAPGMPKSTLFDIDNISYNDDTFLQNGVAKGGLFDGYAPVNTSVSCSGRAIGDLANHRAGIQTLRVTPERVYTYCINTRDDDINLFGEAVMKLSPSSGAFRYDLLALSNSESGDVIANPLFDAITQQDTPLGVRMGRIDGSGSATDNIEDINSVFRHASFEGLYDSLEQMPDNSYINEAGEAESLLVVSFPFKYRHLHSSSPDYTSNPVLRDFGTSTIEYTLDELNDNSADRQSVDFDANVDHYDYDFGFSDQAFAALNAFNQNGAALGYPNHGNNNAFIYGETATDNFGNLRLWDDVFVDVGSFDTSERVMVVEDSGSFTTVISGGPGIDTPIPERPSLGYEVNLITDEGNALWFSTKGWYNATFTENNGFPAPTIVMTLTTDTLGNSRIDYAVTTDRSLRSFRDGEVNSQ